MKKKAMKKNPFALIATAKELSPRKRAMLIVAIAKALKKYSYPQLVRMAKDALKVDEDVYEAIQEWAEEKERNKDLSDIDVLVSRILDRLEG